MGGNMKKLITILFLLSSVVWGQTTPSDGDIIFTQVGSDDKDVVEFITLVDGLDITKLKITDNGVTQTGGLYTNEGTYDLSSLSGIWQNVPGGTFIRIGKSVTSDDNDASDRILATTITTTTGSFNLSASGDQVIAYIGSSSSPTFIAGINFANSGWITSGTISSNTSYAPGTSSDVELSTKDNYYFSGNVDGDKATTQAALKELSNWTGDNSRIGYMDLTSNIGNSLLPVELTTFSASIANSNVELKWQTATEVNNYGFEIQRQYSDASTSLSMTVIPSGDEGWEKVGFVKGHGNSNSPKEYSFIDKTAENSGKYFYRLKQVDVDGQFEYSPEIEVTFGAPAKFELSQNYPNPFNPTTNIRFTLPEAGNVKLAVYNLLGQKIADLVNQNMEAGFHNITFDGSNLTSGIYIYRLEAGNNVMIRKMQLVR